MGGQSAFHHPAIDVSQESLGPYAWQHRSLTRLRSEAVAATKPASQEKSEGQPELGKHEPQPCALSKPEPEPRSITWEDKYISYPDLKDLPRSCEVFRKIELDPCLSMNLPKPSWNPGRVLQHCIQTFEKLYSQHKPMCFKFGFTHDASVRWRNDKYGYRRRKDFDAMIVLFAAGNAHGPSFSEAALINEFKSYLFANALSIPWLLFLLHFESCFFSDLGCLDCSLCWQLSH